MFDLTLFQSRIDSFSEEYGNDFINFWKWKIIVESHGTSHILDDRHIAETHHKLSVVLPKWQTYRPYDNTPCLATLRTSLTTIAEAYNQLRKYSLLDFGLIPRNVLAPIWQELGRAKEDRGQTNGSGSYAIIAVCKPLLFLWGQTLAFDSKVRNNLPHKYLVDKYSWNWDLDEWMRVMILFSKNLNEDKSAVQFIKKKSEEWYGKDAPVPYGRLLDIYYFEGK